MKRILRFKKRTYVLAGVVAVAAISAVGGYAYFTSTGSGDGTGTVGSATDWEVTGASEAGQLFPLVYPAGAQALIGGNVQNDGSGYQQLNQIVATIVDTSDLGCDAGNFEFYSPGSTWTLTAGNTVATANLASGSSLPDNLAPAANHAFGDLSIAMVDDNTNQDDCQGVTVNITYDAS